MNHKIYSMHNSAISITDNSSVIKALHIDHDGEVFDMVYKHYYKALCAFAVRMVSRAEAEEIVQGAMMWLWENKTTLIPEMSLKSLLFTIVKNKALDSYSHTRLKERIHHTILSKTENKFNDPDLYLENELFRLFHEALERLPENFRLTFEMSRMDGKTHQQIADELHVSVQTVNYHIGQSMKILKKDLKDYLPIFLFLLG